jgi:prepilin-type N-terminal cleavage/methylation domain-containing protein
VHPPALRARRGFTLLEMLLSMSLMLAILGMSTQLFRKQSNTVSTQAGVLDAQQNSRFALSELERELRTAGVGVVDAQPLLVQAGALGLTFNTDLVALDTGDLSAVYINPDADSAAVDVLRTNEKITLPGTSKLYPDTNYMQNTGVPSNAETISYWLSHDSSSSHSNEYILFRRANARPPKVVARGILYDPLDPIFTYYKADTAGVLTPVSAALLPVIHASPIHSAPTDTGRSALTDSIRQVRVQFTSVYHDPRTGQDTPRRLTSTIYLKNAGLIRHATCGNAPLSVAPTVAVTAAGSGVPQTYVTISWTPSVDDGHGEKDVERYAIYRRLSTAATFDEPFGSVVGGASTYSFRDTDLVTGQSWIYGVTAQDCSPLSSPMGETTPVVIP